MTPPGLRAHWRRAAIRPARRGAARPSLPPPSGPSSAPQRRDHSSWIRLPPREPTDCPASFAAITQAYRWHHGIPSTRRLTCHCRSGNAPPRCLQADPSFPLGSQNRGKYVPGMRICEPGPTTQLRRAPSPTAANAASGPSQPIDVGKRRNTSSTARAAADPESRLGDRCRGCLPGRFEVDHRAKFASSVICSAGTRGWGCGSWIAGT